MNPTSCYLQCTKNLVREARATLMIINVNDTISDHTMKQAMTSAT